MTLTELACFYGGSIEKTRAAVKAGEIPHYDDWVAKNDYSFAVKKGKSSIFYFRKWRNEK